MTRTEQMQAYEAQVENAFNALLEAACSKSPELISVADKAHAVGRMKDMVSDLFYSANENARECDAETREKQHSLSTYELVRGIAW